MKGTLIYDDFIQFLYCRLCTCFIAAAARLMGLLRVVGLGVVMLVGCSVGLRSGCRMMVYLPRVVFLGDGGNFGGGGGCRLGVVG